MPYPGRSTTAFSSIFLQYTTKLVHISFASTLLHESLTVCYICMFILIWVLMKESYRVYPVAWHTLLRENKMSILNHTYPHTTPEEELSTHLQSPGWQSIFGVSWCLIWWFANIEKSMVIHDTECPSWDQMPLNNTYTRTEAQTLLPECLAPLRINGLGGNLTWGLWICNLVV